MRIRALGRLTCLSIFVLLLLTRGAFGAGKGVRIKIAALLPEGSTWIEIFNELNAEVKNQTDGRVRFKIYPGGVLGDESDMLRKMYIGQIQGAVLSSASLSVLFKEMDVFQIPFLFQNYNEVDYLEQKMGAFFRKGLEKKGYVLLGWSEGGFVRLMSTTPIATLDDLKKAKVWTWEDAPFAKAIFDEAQIATIPLSIPDVLVGLQTGLIEVVYAPPSGAISLQWFTKVRYITDVPLIYLIGGIVMKKKVFEQLSDTDQNTVLQLFKKHMKKMKRLIRNDNTEAIRVMKKHGIKVLKPSVKQIQKFKAVSNQAIGRMIDINFSKAVLDQVHFHLAEFRKVKK